MHKLKLRFLDSEPMFFAPESRIQQKPYWCCFLLRGGAPSLGVFGFCFCFLVFGPLLVTLWAASVFCFLAAGAFWTGLGTLFSALLHGPLPKSGMCISLPATLISAFCPPGDGLSVFCFSTKSTRVAQRFSGLLKFGVARAFFYACVRSLVFVFCFLFSAFCFLLSAFCFLLSAFCFLLFGFWLLYSAFCFLLSAFCFLFFGFWILDSHIHIHIHIHVCIRTWT